MSVFGQLAAFARRRRGIVAICFLGVVLLTPFSRVLLHPSAVTLGQKNNDSPSMFFFLYDFAARCWRGGEISLWNPHIMLGIPFLGEGQASIFHPLTAFFLFLPTGVAMNAIILSCVLLGGLAFYGYLRSMDLGRTASVLGAIIWSFSSVPISRIYAGHLSILLGFPAWPFVLMCWHRYRRDRRLRHLALLALGYASLLLAAHPQPTFIFSQFFLVYVLILGVTRPGDAGAAKWTRELLRLGLFLGLGIALGAVQLLPTIDFAQHSFRNKSSYEFCASFSLPPESLITLLCPEFFGRTKVPGVGQFWGRNLFWEAWLYIGILPLLAAVTGLMTAPIRRRLALGIPGLLFLIIGLGKFTPLFYLLYEYVPFYDLFRSPAKHCMVTVFCLAALSAYGIEAWLGGLRADEGSADRAMRTRAFRWTLVIGIAMLAGCLVLLLVPALGSDTAGTLWQRWMNWVYDHREINIPSPNDPFPDVQRQAAHFTSVHLLRTCALLLLSLAGIVGLRRWLSQSGTSKTSRWRPRVGVLFITGLLLGDFFTFIPHFSDCFDPSRLHFSDEFLKALPKTPYPTRYYDHSIHPNMAMRYDLTTIGGYASNLLRRYNHFLNQTQGFDASTSQALVTLRSVPDVYLSLLAIDALHLPRSDAPADMPPTPTHNGWAMLDCRGHCPRVFIAASPQAFPSEDDVLAYVTSAGVDSQRSPAIETADPLPAAAPLDKAEHVEIASFRANRVELAVETVRPRVVVLNEMFYPGWTARVNGQSVPVRQANYLFRAVEVPAGRSTIEFVFRPWSFTAGAVISILGLAFVGAVLAWPWRGLRPRA